MNPHHGRARALVQPEPDRAQAQAARWRLRRALSRLRAAGAVPVRREPNLHAGRSEEHTSELQSRLHLVCRLLLEKKKKWKTCHCSESLRTTSASRHSVQSNE